MLINFKKRGKDNKIKLGKFSVSKYVSVAPDQCKNLSSKFQKGNIEESIAVLKDRMSNTQNAKLTDLDISDDLTVKGFVISEEYYSTEDILPYLLNRVMGVIPTGDQLMGMAIDTKYLDSSGIVRLKIVGLDLYFESLVSESVEIEADALEEGDLNEEYLRDIKAVYSKNGNAYFNESMGRAIASLYEEKPGSISSFMELSSTFTNFKQHIAETGTKVKICERVLYAELEKQGYTLNSFYSRFSIDKNVFDGAIKNGELVDYYSVKNNIADNLGVTVDYIVSDITNNKKVEHCSKETSSDLVSLFRRVNPLEVEAAIKEFAKEYKLDESIPYKESARDFKDDLVEVIRDKIPTNMKDYSDEELIDFVKKIL